MHVFILKNTLKLLLKYTQISLLHVSVFDHRQGSCTEPAVWQNPAIQPRNK